MNKVTITKKRLWYYTNTSSFVEPCTSFEFPTDFWRCLCNNKVFFFVISLCSFIHSIIKLSYKCSSAPQGLPSCQKVCEIRTFPRRRRCGSQKSSGTPNIICEPQNTLCEMSSMATGIRIRGGISSPRSITQRSSSGSSSWTRALLLMMIGAGDFIYFLT